MNRIWQKKDRKWIQKGAGLLVAAVLGTGLLAGCGKDAKLDSALKVTPKPEVSEHISATMETQTQSPVADTPQVNPTQTSEQELMQTPELKRIVAIDAGHQGQGNSQQEPVGPGASETKAKVTSGTSGEYSGLAEYELNLIVAKKLRDLLEARGYEVVMIRETHDVDISNRERAQIANTSGAQVFVRIHADSSTNTSANGASTLYPGENNPYVSALSRDSQRLSEAIVAHISDSTGCNNRGAIVRDDMSGINWCEIPVSIVEMGFMSNPEEDARLGTDEYQTKVAEGIADGIDEYFGR